MPIGFLPSSPPCGVSKVHPDNSGSVEEYSKEGKSSPSAITVRYSLLLYTIIDLEDVPCVILDGISNQSTPFVDFKILIPFIE